MCGHWMVSKDSSAFIKDISEERGDPSTDVTADSPYERVVQFDV